MTITPSPLLLSPGRATPTAVGERPPFIVFEGGDGVGKSTQIDLLVSRLLQAGKTVVKTREPGEGAFGKRIRNILLDTATGEISPRAEALLFCADRAEHVDAVIRPALRQGNVVVCDRYIDSTFAYQGAGRQTPLEGLETVAWWAADGLRPDLTVLLDMDPEVAISGIEEPDRMELEGAQFRARLREEFLKRARADSGRYLVVDARGGSAQEIAEVVWRRVSTLL